MKNVMLKQGVFLMLCLGIFRNSEAQENMSFLKKYSDSIRFSKVEQKRMLYNDSFKFLLNDMLSDENVFNFSWDSIAQTVSVLVSDDNKMKVISWALVNDKEEFTNHCVVLYKKSDKKSTQTYWLNAHSLHKTDSLYEEYNVDFWPSALYYQIYHFKRKGKDYYCVLGFNGKNSFMNQKIIDVLWVDKQNELHIGAPVFYSSPNDYTPQYRVFYEYADQSTMFLRFEKEIKSITFSNLVPSNYEKLALKQYYIPDGRIDFYRLSKKGKWIKYEDLENADIKDNPVK